MAVEVGIEPTITRLTVTALTTRVTLQFYFLVHLHGYDPCRSSQSSRSPNFIRVRRSPKLRCINFGTRSRSRTGTHIATDFKSVVSTNSTIRALLNLVGDMGLEPTRLSTLESKSSAATNYANPPFKLGLPCKIRTYDFLTPNQAT